METNNNKTCILYLSNQNGDLDNEVGKHGAFYQYVANKSKDGECDVITINKPKELLNDDLINQLSEYGNIYVYGHSGVTNGGVPVSVKGRKIGNIVYGDFKNAVSAIIEANNGVSPKFRLYACFTGNGVVKDTPFKFQKDYFSNPALDEEVYDKFYTSFAQQLCEDVKGIKVDAPCGASSCGHVIKPYDYYTYGDKGQLEPRSYFSVRNFTPSPDRDVKNHKFTKKDKKNKHGHKRAR